MWSNFYAAGGWGMHPTAILGFFMIASSVLYALRPQTTSARLVFTLGCVTFAFGLAGAVSGICTTLHYLPQVEGPKQLEIMALGIEESLHSVLLALILVLFGGLVAVFGSLRRKSDTAPVTAAG
jgi:hypothetical protein